MQKDRIKIALVRLLVFVSIALGSVWLFQTTTNHDHSIQQTAPTSPTPDLTVSESEEPMLLDDIFVLDKDGVYEICLPIVSYYGMDGLRSVGETPLPEIVFKYDSKRARYLPANHLFVDFALRGLRREPEENTYKHHRFHVLLQYVYAGKEKEGWASFDKYYRSADKETMRSRIKLRLKADPVYRYIYQNRNEFVSNPAKS